MNIRNGNRLWAILGISGLAVALATAPVRASDEPALKGPEVRERNVPGVEGEFGGERRKYANETRLPPKVFRDALETIMSADAPAELRVSAEQKAKFEGWMQDFQRDTKAYQQANRDEVQKLRAQAGDGPKPGSKKASGSNEPMTEQEASSATAARDRLRQINDGQPKVEDVYTKVWTELSEAQRKAVDAKIDEFRQQQSKERQEKYVRDRMQRKNLDNRPADAKTSPPQDPPGARAPAPGNTPGGPITPERRERLMQLFSQMTPDQQDEVLRRIEQHLAGNDAQPAATKKSPGKKRPPRPGTDDLMNPPPAPQGEPPVPPMQQP